MYCYLIFRFSTPENPTQLVKNVVALHANVDDVESVPFSASALIFRCKLIDSYNHIDLLTPYQNRYTHLRYWIFKKTNPFKSIFFVFFKKYFQRFENVHKYNDGVFDVSGCGQFYVTFSFFHFP